MYTPANTDTFEPEGYYHLFNHAIGDENLRLGSCLPEHFIVTMPWFVTTRTKA